LATARGVRHGMHHLISFNGSTCGRNVGIILRRAAGADHILVWVFRIVRVFTSASIAAAFEVETSRGCLLRRVSFIRSMITEIAAQERKRRALTGRAFPRLLSLWFHAVVRS